MLQIDLDSDDLDANHRVLLLLYRLAQRTSDSSYLPASAMQPADGTSAYPEDDGRDSEASQSERGDESVYAESSLSEWSDDGSDGDDNAPSESLAK
jgi:hypothetical protein